MKKILLFTIFSLFCFGTVAQTKTAFLRAGEKAMTKGDFFAAMNYFEEALEFPGPQTMIRYQYGEAARQFFAYNLAIQQYQLVLKDKKNADRFPLTRFWLSSAYQSTGQYQKAINGFNDFIKNTRNALFEEKAMAARENCTWALSLINQSHNLEIKHLDKKINTPYSEFGAVRRGDTLYYSSYRYRLNTDQTSPQRRTTKVLTQIGTAKGRPLTRKFNEMDKLTAHTSLTPDGQRIYYTLCDYTDEVNIRCQIYFRDLDKRKRWGKAQKLPELVNLDGFTTTQPAWGINPATQKAVLYFSSDRPGGKGGLDIYQVETTERGFGTPVNLTEINTEADDITPFYHQKSQTLFFSSKGYQRLGGFDIYQARHNGTGWEVPQHTGYPLNSSYNDIYFTLNADSTQAYIASNRTGSYYLEEKNKACCNDIFEVNINLPLPAVPAVPAVPEVDTTTLVVVPPVKLIPPVAPVLIDTTPIILSPPVDPVPAITPSSPIATTIEKFKSVLPLPLYFHNDQPDARSLLETTRMDYQVTYDAYIQRREEYLNAVLESERQDIIDFFERDLKTGFAIFLEFCENITVVLQNGKEVTLTLRGYTSPRAQSEYNFILGKRRTASIINFFKKYKNGIFVPFLDRGQLKINEISLGETRASPSVSDLLQDRRNSIYIPAAALERRVDVVSIKIE